MEMIQRTAAVSILPPDCLLTVFNFLEPRDLLNVQQVCKWWEFLSRHAWKKYQKLDLYNLMLHKDYQEQEILMILKRCGGFVKWLHVQINSDCNRILASAHRNCRSLEALVLSFMATSEVSDTQLEYLRQLMQANPSINKIRLTQLGERALELSESFSDSLREISISGVAPLNAVPFQVAQFQQLQKLELIGYRIQNTDLTEIERLPQLSALIFKYCFFHEDVDTRLSQISTLRELELHTVLHFRDRAVRHLILNSNALVCLKMQYLQEVITGHTLRCIAQLPLLKTLSLHTMDFQSDIEFGSFNNLHELRISDCSFIRIGPLLSILRNSPRLHTFFITQSIEHKKFMLCVDSILRARRDQYVKLWVTTRLIDWVLSDRFSEYVDFCWHEG